jgi:selenocysteine lyase/cysteine desulfurase
VRSAEEVYDARVVRPARATRPGRGSFDGDLRPGTLNAPGIIRFGAALSLPRDEAGPAEALEKLLEGLQAMKDVVRVNGSPDRSNGRIVHMTVTGGSPALRKFDDPELVSPFASKYNTMLSTGAACSQHGGRCGEPSRLRRPRRGTRTDPPRQPRRPRRTLRCSCRHRVKWCGCDTPCHGHRSER